MPDFTTRPEILGTFGVVASTHWLATATGMAILERGGNAFDAAAAAGFALQVVEPHLNGPGGDLPIILYSAGKDAVEVICGQGVAPQAATVAVYRELGLDLVPGNGLLAAVVPGAFDAWLRMLRDHGTLRLRDVLEPAIAFARRGYPLVPTISATIERVRHLFDTEWPTSAAVYLPGGQVPAPGSLFRNPTLADTYERILREAEGAGPDREAQIEAARGAWYRGFVAEAIDRFCRRNEVLDVTGRRHRGLAHRRRSGALAGDRRATAPVRLSRLYLVQGRAVEPGASRFAAACSAQGLRSCRSLRHGTRVRAYLGRVREACLRRPRSLLR